MILGLLFNSQLQARELTQVKLNEIVKDVIQLSENKIEIKSEDCGEKKSQAFVNFSEDHLKDPPGFHGMLFFGTQDSFYISHLPMFHKPHDYQAIVEVRLPQKEREKYLQALKSQGGIFTFAPQGDFVLPEVITQKKPITGTLYQGHFERGGSELFTAELELIRVVFYKKITPDEKKLKEKRFVIFGNEKEYFLAHEIFGRPNVDEILTLKGPNLLDPNLKEELKKAGVSFLDGVRVERGNLSYKKDSETHLIPFTDYYREDGDLR